MQCTVQAESRASSLPCGQLRLSAENHTATRSVPSWEGRDFGRPGCQSGRSGSSVLSGRVYPGARESTDSSSLLLSSPAPRGGAPYPTSPASAAMSLLSPPPEVTSLGNRLFNHPESMQNREGSHRDASIRRLYSAALIYIYIYKHTQYLTKYTPYIFVNILLYSIFSCDNTEEITLCYNVK